MQERIRTGVLCLHQDHLLAVEMADPDNGKRFWTLPGGAVEDRETLEDCAVRETLEETGYQVRLTGHAATRDYVFHWNGTDYACTTHWFMAVPINMEPATVNDADYLLRAEWLPWPESRPLFNYHASLSEAVGLLV